jgi:hypothetical protein
MKPQRAKELLPVIEAFANGEEVEFRLDKHSEWQYADDLSFDVYGAEYRIKPVPRDDKWAMQQMRVGKNVRRRAWGTGSRVRLDCDGVVHWTSNDAYFWDYEDSTATDWEIAE